MSQHWPPKPLKASANLQDGVKATTKIGVVLTFFLYNWHINRDLYLNLPVVDLDMLSEVRSIHSLSGGESFLISLALGLSSLSSNRMHIESLFIDERFGSLYADTLRVTMVALKRLQTQRRKIGVISHVAEMTERIPTQIRVIKTANGRSKIEIV